MPRLIDADALFKEYERVAWYNNADRDEIAEEVLLQMPTIDPESLRKKGEWIMVDFAGTVKCSVCGELNGETNFCPNCGADMRGE